MAVTIEELQLRCNALATRIGHKSAVSFHMSSVGPHYMHVMPDLDVNSSKSFWHDDINTMFAAAEAWLEERLDPEAEWLSWQPDQFAQADTGAA